MVWPPASAPDTFEVIDYAGLYGGKRSLDRWKYKTRPPRTTLNGALTNVQNNVTVTNGNLPGQFPQTGVFPIIVEAEQMFVVLGAGTNNWTVVRGVNGTAAVAHASGLPVLGKSWFDVVCLGDSTVQCTTQGIDGWVERFRRALSIDVGGGGQFLGTGHYPLWRSGAGSTVFGVPANNTASEWNLAGFVSPVGVGSASDVMLFNAGLLGLNAAAVATFTIPSFVNAVSADIMYVATTGTGQISYSINGGAFVNVPGTMTLGAGVQMHRSTIALGAGATTIAIRCADAAAVNHTGILVGVDLWSVAPVFGTTTGVRIHNLGYDAQVLFGNNFTFALDRANAAGDNYGMFDGQPGSIYPDLLVLGPFTNDLNLTTNATVQAHLVNLINRVKPYCDVVGVICSEQNRSGLPVTVTTTPANTNDQAVYRSAFQRTLLANGCAVLNVYDAFVQEGDPSFATANADGLMFDALHWSALGCTDVGARVARILLGGY